MTDPSELDSLRHDVEDLHEELALIRTGVMQAIHDAGVHTQVCDDDTVPDMVRAALAAVKARHRPVPRTGGLIT